MADTPTLSGTFGTQTVQAVVTTSGALQTALLQQLSVLTRTTGSNQDLVNGQTVGAGITGVQGVTSVTGAHSPVLTLPIVLGSNGNLVLGTSFPGQSYGQPVYTDTVTGGSGTSIILANANLPDYIGAARAVFASSATGNIVDTAGAATLGAVDGTYTVTGYGSDSYLLGGANSTVTAFSLGTGSTATLNGGAVFHAGAADTIFGDTGGDAAGADTVFASTGNLFYDRGESTRFISGGSSSTIVGGTGTETISGSHDGDLVYTGTGGTTFTSGGGHDTVWGNFGGSTTATIFGTTNSYELLVYGTKGTLLIGQGDNTVLDGANSDRGLFFYARPEFGNETLIGSVQNTPGQFDSFHIGAQTVGTSTITIDNFKSGDRLDLTAFGADQQNAAFAAFAGGKNSFTLSDGTTITFGEGSTHPHTNSGGYMFG